jgi:hypothetical protein
MKEITIGVEPKQKITILYEDTTIILTVKFRPTIASWTVDINFRDGAVVNGKKLVCGLELLKQFNKPFDLTLVDNSNTGIDPFKQDDFSTGRISIYLLERADLIELRGYDVI